MAEIDVGKGLFAIVDDQDVDLVSRYKWHAFERHGLVYAKHNFYSAGKYRSLLMHRLLMDPPSGMVVDHIDGNGLDNRRDNLRVCTNAENMRNRSPRRGSTSRYLGVHWNKRDRRWIAAVCRDGKKTCLGSFIDEVSAAEAYDRAASVIHGSFARLNFPQKGVF